MAGHGLTEQEKGVLSVCLWDKPMDVWALVCGTGLQGNGKSARARKVIGGLVARGFIDEHQNDNVVQYKITEDGKQAWSAAS